MIKVTNAKGSSYDSQHQWYIAADFYLNEDVDGDGSKSDDAFNNSSKLFEQVGKIATDIGLGWGGNWASKDRPHLYYKQWGSTPTPLKQKYGTPDKFKATWATVEDKKVSKATSVKKHTSSTLHNANVLAWQKAMNIGFNYLNEKGQILKSGYLVEDGYFGPKSRAFAGKHYLHKNLKGSPTAIKWLQKRLIDLGYKPLASDGLWQNYTEKWFTQFQADNNLTIDGYCGVKSTTKLLEK